MKTTFDLMRVWAAITGLVLAAVYFGCLFEGVKSFAMLPMLPMLIAGIGGFEMVLYAQDVWFKRRGRQNG